MEEYSRVANARILGIEKLLEGVDTEIAVAAAPGEILTVSPGDKVRVRAQIEYMGPALSDTFYAAIGSRVVVFDEYWKGSTPISFPASATWATYQLTTDVPITQIGGGGYYDLYVKLVNNPGIGMPELSNVIQVVIKGEFRNFKITGYDKV